jgi:hypothetical protein
MYNPNKTVTANSKGIIISFRDCNKHKYIPYQSKAVQEIQLGKAKYQQLDRPVFNKTQQKLYAETVYGLTVLSAEQIKELSPKRKHEIISVYKRVQHFLNKLKQEVINEQVNALLSALFHKSLFIKQMCEVKSYDRGYKDRHTFKELGLTQEKIAEKLVNAGLLPSNFFELA